MSFNYMPYGTLRDIADELKNIRELLEKQSTTEQSSMVGEWIDNGDRYFRCSLCGAKDTDTYKWCHGCGSKMKGAEDD